MLFHPYFSRVSHFNMLQAWIAIQCFAYYVFDRPAVIDDRYDQNAKQLKHLIDKYPGLHEESKYYKAFVDFDPSTGYDLLDKIKANYPDKYLLLMAQASKLVFG